MLGLLGRRINALPLPGMRTHHDERPHGWQRWARLVSDRPWPALVAGVVLLAVLASPLRALHLGQTDVGALPKDTQARQAYDRMSAGFGAGSNGPMLVAVDLSAKPAKADQHQLDQINQQEQQQKQKAQQPGLAAGAADRGRPGGAGAGAGRRPAAGAGAGPADARPAGPADHLTGRQPAQEGRAARDRPAPAAAAQGPADHLRRQVGHPAAGQRARHRRRLHAHRRPARPSVDAGPRTSSTTLRDTVIPKATKGQGMTADVGGTTAGYIDLAKQITSQAAARRSGRAGPLFVLLLLAFRSLLVPLKAVVMNLLSIAAAFGVVTLRRSATTGRRTLRRARRRRYRSSPTCR